MSPNTRSRGQTSDTISACLTRSVVVAGPGFSKIFLGGRKLVIGAPFSRSRRRRGRTTITKVRRQKPRRAGDPARNFVIAVRPLVRAEAEGVGGEGAAVFGEHVGDREAPDAGGDLAGEGVEAFLRLELTGERSDGERALDR